MSPSAWMIYGANGHTGRRIVREAVERGLQPTIAGRNAPAVRALAEQCGCPLRVFALQQANQVAEQLAGMGLVLHCAGPFSATAEVMIEACLSAGVHYLDITGEIGAIEQAAARHQRALDRGVVLLPAVGFDVVPSDCLAAMLAERLPGAVRLELAICGRFRPSRGTLRTMLEGLADGAWVRSGGRLVRVPLAHRTITVPLPGAPTLAATIPWGDVASAWQTTGIPEIEVYCTLDRGQFRLLRMLRFVAPVLRLRIVRTALARAVLWCLGPHTRSGGDGHGEERVASGHGPDHVLSGRATRPSRERANHALSRRATRPDSEDTQSRTDPTPGSRSGAAIWGRVSDAEGRSVEAVLHTIEPYRLTVLAALAALERVLAGEVQPGFATPARALGRDLILQLPGMRLEWV